MSISPLRALALAFAIGVIDTAAASAQSGSSASVAAAPQQQEAPRPARPRRDRERISAEEIAERTETDAYSLINALRSTWLRPRGETSLRGVTNVQVYVNGMLQSGGVQALRQIQRASVQSVEHMDASRATERFGVDHGAGAILITLH